MAFWLLLFAFGGTCYVMGMLHASVWHRTIK